MYCTDCGTENTVDSKYCKECGTKINDGYRTMMLSVQDLPVGQSDAAVDSLTRLLDMAFWHNEAGNVDAAVTAAQAALAINPNSTTAHSLLGTLYEKKGEDALAVEHFEAVLALNPDSAADRAKLEQLRRGVHVKAVAPPLAHQWVPPALRTLAPRLQKSWAAKPWASRAGRPVSFPLQRRPLAAAGLASALILGVGLLVVHPWGRADAAPSRLVPAAPPPAPAGLSAFAAPAPAVFPAPMILRAAGGPSFLASGPTVSAVPLPASDPYAGRASAPRIPSPAYALPPVPPRAKRRRAGTLPRLSLAALPPIGSGEGGSEGLAPAPVTLPPGLAAAPLASVAPVPLHTVVVSSLGAGTPALNANRSEPSSHIRISVRSATEADAAPAESYDAGAGGGDSQADGYQQRALSLQQASDFRGARLAYGRAIRAYQSQIAAGRDVETAQRGLAACQTGLEICLQSQ